MAKTSSEGPWWTAMPVGFRSSSQHTGSWLGVCEGGGLTGLFVVPSWIYGIPCFGCKTHTNMDKPEEDEAKQGHMCFRTATRWPLSCLVNWRAAAAAAWGSLWVAKRPCSHFSVNRHNSYGVAKSSLCQSQVPQGDTDWRHDTTSSHVSEGSWLVCLCSSMGRDLFLERRGLEKAEYKQDGAMRFGW